MKTLGVGAGPPWTVYGWGHQRSLLSKLSPHLMVYRLGHLPLLPALLPILRLEELEKNSPPSRFLGLGCVCGGGGGGGWGAVILPGKHPDTGRKSLGLLVPPSWKPHVSVSHVLAPFFIFKEKSIPLGDSSPGVPQIPLLSPVEV